MSLPSSPVPDPWLALRRHTAARIALGHAGVSQPTVAQLAFQLAHAQARDAVHLALDVPALQQALRALGHEVLSLHSAAPDRLTYLQRPDLGRQLDAPSRQKLLDRYAADENGDERVHDVAFIVADGLSAMAAATHALPLLSSVLPRLEDLGWSIAPLCVVQQSRVALSDEVGELLKARQVLILIGERPGLSSPDSLGLYMTWMPRVGLTDADRNCISNVRPEGLTTAEAAARLLHLLVESRRRQVSGVAIKDDMPPHPPAVGTT